MRLYRIHNRPNSIGELTFIRDLPSLELAVHHAGLAIDGRPKRFSHQCLIPNAALNRAKKLLTAAAAQLKACRTFHDLHSLLADMFKPVHGLGELYIYDTALRLGAFLKLRPRYVYLHRGTRTGARALGLDVSRGYLDVASLPKPIQALEPHEIEDFLCIYKDRF